LSYAVVLAATHLVKVAPHERTGKHKMYGRDVDEAIINYQAETRRKGKTTFVGALLLFN